MRRFFFSFLFFSFFISLVDIRISGGTGCSLVGVGLGDSWAHRGVFDCLLILTIISWTEMVVICTYSTNTAETRTPTRYVF